MVQEFRVTEMSCQHCVNAVTEEVSRLPGVQKVNVNLATKAVKVETTQPVATDLIVAAINEAGYEDVVVLG